MTYSDPQTGTSYTLRVDGTNATITNCEIHEADFTIPATVRPFQNTLTITGIDRNAFKDCIDMYTLTIPDTVTSIGDYAFMSCGNLTTINMPSHLDALGKGAFSGCRSLRSITIPNGITKINDAMFSNCQNLTTINLPAGLTAIGRSAFGSCHALRRLELPGNLTYLGLYAFVDCSLLESITIPSGISEIYEGTFKDCSALTGITLPEGLRKISDCAFYNCVSLNNIELPDSLRSTGMFVFGYCESLESVTIPDSLDRISDGMFSHCTSLREVNIPSSVWLFGCGVFRGCTSLRSFIMPDTVIRTEGMTFEDCTGLSNVKFSANYRSIGAQEFRNCTSLRRITIPERIDYMGARAFEGCANLAEAYFLGNVPEYFDYWVFDNCAPDFKIKYIFGKTGWSNPFRGYPAEIVYDLDDNIPELEPPVQINPGALENRPEALLMDAVSLRALPGVGFVRLEWNIAYRTRDVIGYRLYKATAPGTQAEASLIRQTDALTYIDPDVQNGITYYYTVKPVFSDNSLGNASNEVSVSPYEAGGAVDLTLDNPVMESNGLRKEIDKGFGTAPFMKEDRIYIPIRALIEEMGGVVEWSGTQKKVTVIFNGITVELFLGQTTAYINSVATTLEAAPFASGTGRTMLPLRFVGESLGCIVSWDGDTKTATVSYDTKEQALAADSVPQEPSPLPAGVPDKLEAPVISNLTLLKDDSGRPYFRAEITVPQSVATLDVTRPTGGWVDLDIDGKADGRHRRRRRSSGGFCR
jgi:hypothetical protein